MKLTALLILRLAAAGAEVDIGDKDSAEAVIETCSGRAVDAERAKLNQLLAQLSCRSS